MDGLEAFRDAVDKSDFPEALGLIQAAHDAGVLRHWVIAWAAHDEGEDEPILRLRYSDGIGALSLSSYVRLTIGNGLVDVPGD